FPGAVLAVRAARSGPVHESDGLYVYLPEAFLMPGDTVTYYVADDGSTYTVPDFDTMALARAAEGQIYPPRIVGPSTAPADGFRTLNRKPGGLRLTDPARFAGAGVLVEAALFTGVFQ